MSGKVTSYKGDWCKTCELPVVSYRKRSLFLMHFFFVPVIPIGFRLMQHCQHCDNDPREEPERSDVLLAWGTTLSCMAIFGVLLILAMDTKKSTLYLSSLVIIALCILAYRGLRKKYRIHTEPGHSLILDSKLCRLCDGEIDNGPTSRCLNCGIIIERAHES